jgi:hypothetical protein
VFLIRLPSVSLEQFTSRIAPSLNIRVPDPKVVPDEVYLGKSDLYASSHPKPDLIQRLVFFFLILLIVF